MVAGRERGGGGGADGIRWVDSAICNDGLYIKHIFTSTLGPSVFIPKYFPLPTPPTPKKKKMKLTLIDHTALISNMNFQSFFFPEFRP